MFVIGPCLIVKSVFCCVIVFCGEQISSCCVLLCVLYVFVCGFVYFIAFVVRLSDLCAIAWRFSVASDI